MSQAAGSFIWYELMTTDADAAASFYGRVIGWHDSVDTAEILQPVAYIAAWRL